MQLQMGPDVNMEFTPIELKYFVSKLGRVQQIDMMLYKRFNRMEDKCNFLKNRVEKGLERYQQSNTSVT